MNIAKKIYDATKVKPQIFKVHKYIEVDSFKVLCDKNYGAPYISVHYPVVADVRF